MKDFTLKAYSKYIQIIKSKGYTFYSFDEFLKLEIKPEKFCLLRHDVDRKPINALKMAEIEFELGVKSTFYFRTKPHVLKPVIIKKISKLGHEIGYHYESLSDTNGNIQKAVEDFKVNLSKLRKIAIINTCSMHGRPLKPYDNRDIWKEPQNHKLLLEELNILGEIYLDMDYSDIAYINDTGRNWTSGESNRRDKVISRIKADFENQEKLLNYLNSEPHNKIVFQIHPERWSDNNFEWLIQNIKDKSINLIKNIIK